MEIHTGNLDERKAYRLLTGSILPRPIAWVTSLDPATGVINLAPFSFFTGCSVVPPMVCFAVERRKGAKKDTVRNIEATGEFVLNVVTEELGEAMVISAGDFPPEESEVAAAGLDLVPSSVVRPPRVAAAPVHMECRMFRILEVGSSPHSLVIGQVEVFHVADHLIDEAGRIDYNRLHPLGRLAGDFYCTIADQRRIIRRDWRKETY